ncbi:acetylxylan esterase [Streptomyces ochraceiscleroticus]|uniref:Acetylxylan esterase n=1 Tax=Streptomyces ochraceiscleroticus TaxID=47761 RepID=A0ABW1MSE0_9ACTN|nr:acetylxylan esterase [Streptomyces ochraceiscleroticus]
MPFTDLPLDQLRAFQADMSAPVDFDAFWKESLALSYASADAPTVTPLRDTLLTTVEAADVRFPGWRGQPVAAWLVRPAGADGPLPTVITYLGYGCGRGLPTDHLLFPSAGYIQLIVDSRGQGHDTPDQEEGDAPQWVGGFMTRGMGDPRHHYYRRLITDCVRAVDAARALPYVDTHRIVVQGGSQGGGLALAVAGLVGDRVAGVLADVPFLCHFRRGATVATEGPYAELVQYLRRHTRDDPERAFGTLDYFDGLHFAARASAPALFSVGLMDPVCPPSTVYAAFNRYAGRAAMKVWPYADHGGGQGSTPPEQLRWLRDEGLSPGVGR